MGASPWIDDLIWRVMTSGKYRRGETFMVRAGRQTVRGTVEFGRSFSGRKLIMVTRERGDVADLPITRETLIDGVRAPDWRETVQ